MQEPVTPVNTVNELNFGCLNARSARNKAALIHDLINDSRLDILTLTETWFRPDDPPAITDDAAPDGFTIRNVIRRRPSLHHKSSPNRSSIGRCLAVIYRNDHIRLSIGCRQYIRLNYNLFRLSAPIQLLLLLTFIDHLQPISEYS